MYLQLIHIFRVMHHHNISYNYNEQFIESSRDVLGKVLLIKLYITYNTFIVHLSVINMHSHICYMLHVSINLKLFLAVLIIINK